MVRHPRLGVVFLDGQAGREAVFPPGQRLVRFAPMTDGIPGPATVPGGPGPGATLRLAGAGGETDGSDIIDDWHALSRLPNRWRSPALQEIDRALDRWKKGGREDPRDFSRNVQELQEVIDAIKKWEDAKDAKDAMEPPSLRRPAVDRLGERIRAERDAARRRVPSARDLEIALSLGVPEGTGPVEQEIGRVDRALSAAARASGAGVPTLRQRREDLREDSSILGAMRGRTDWTRLRPVQIAALVLAERRGQAIAARERHELASRLRDGRWAWSASYPLADGEIGALIDRVHDFMRHEMILTINTKRGILDNALRDYRVAIKNHWTLGSRTINYQNLRGGVEESLGYAASVKRNTEAGGIYRKEQEVDHGDLWFVEPLFSPTDDDRRDLPKYAALVSPRRPEGGVRYYGDMVFHLKPGVRGRATFTPQDSHRPAWRAPSA